MKICPHCNTNFSPTTVRQKFCCRNCSIYFWNSKNNFKPKQDPAKKKEYNAHYRATNKVKISETNIIWYTNNKEKAALYGKSYRTKNSLKIQEINKKWKIKNKEKITNHARERYNEDIEYQLRCVLRARLNQAIKNKQKVGSAISDLGCSVAKLKIHLQLKFHRNPRGKHEYMTWDNWGVRGWHIDHIRPLSSYNLTDPKQLKEACSYRNLQPLWAKDNLSKSDKSDFKYIQEVKND